MTPTFIAIYGASGSGKTTLVNSLTTILNDKQKVPVASGISIDNYYRDLRHLSKSERDRINFDHPDSIEVELLASHLDSLKMGKSIETPSYDFTSHLRSNNVKTIFPTAIVFVEGMFAMSLPQVTRLFDRSIYVKAPLDTCFKRRLNRDRTERLRTHASIQSSWSGRTLPMFVFFVLPMLSHANFIVDGNLSLKVASAAVMDWLVLQNLTIS